jgi:23S rRNA pseudouridine2605 synthase
MKKTSHFEKFIPKKKNSVIKEEFRQQKKKWKKERAEAIEKKKLEKKTQVAQQPGHKGIGGKAYAAKAPLIKRKAASQMPLNKYISHCGICSRRDAAILVREGKIKVNGEVVTEPGHKVSPSDEVKMGGKKLFLAHNLVYILLNKPKDYITTADDPQGRKTVLDLVRGATQERVFPVGRLDRNTTGVLLLTNDGELTQKLSHPSYEIRKLYEVKLDKPLVKADFEKILHGVTLEDGFVQADALAYADTKDKSVIGIEIHSGRNRIVRRIFEKLGYDVKGLDRVMFANLTKKDVDRGKWRFLKEKEIRLLKFMNSSFIRKNKTVPEKD